MKLVNISRLKFLILKVLLVVAIFTALFSIIPDEHWNNMNNKNEEKSIFNYLFNRMYFVMTTFSTAGFGDIYPLSKYARFATMLLQLSVAVVIIDHISL